MDIVTETYLNFGFSTKVQRSSTKICFGRKCSRQGSQLLLPFARRQLATARIMIHTRLTFQCKANLYILRTYCKNIQITSINLTTFDYFMYCIISVCFMLVSCLAYSSTLKMYVIVPHIPENRTLHNHCCENFKSYRTLVLRFLGLKCNVIISAFGNKPRRMLKVFRSFAADWSCHFQCQYLRREWKPLYRSDGGSRAADEGVTGRKRLRNKANGKCISDPMCTF
jgi:hypothetical protein